ncbi:MAG: PDZ domain-containing protein, partial [Phycisphaerales bacterium]|nr:PDZ domain-containing protein [Phycisphaerales bacterium]
DVVTSVGGRPTPTSEELVRALSELDVGATVEVTVRRGKMRLPLGITLVALEEVEAEALERPRRNP